MSAPRSQEPATLLYKVADLAELPSELPSGPICWELNNGKIIPMSPPGDLQGMVESRLVVALAVQGESRGFGKVRCGEVEFGGWR